MEGTITVLETLVLRSSSRFLHEKIARTISNTNRLGSCTASWVHSVPASSLATRVANLTEYESMRNGEIISKVQSGLPASDLAAFRRQTQTLSTIPTQP